MTVRFLLVFTVMWLWSNVAVATILSGELRLDNQDILISPTQKYHGQFDLRSKLPMGDQFVLSKVIINFRFQDDKEWVRTPGPNSMEDTGKVNRHDGIALRNKRVSGQTDHYYIAKRTIHMTNEEEVVELTIGRNIFYGTTIRRREVTRENLGQKSVNLGAYRDIGDNHRTRQHFRITESVLETYMDGYDGLFEIGRKQLDLATVQDLAYTGLLEFELGGKGDYIFVDATLLYEGYVTGLDVKENTGNSLFSGSLWLALFSIPIGGILWRKKSQNVAVYKSQKRITQRRVPDQRAF